MITLTSQSKLLNNSTNTRPTEPTMVSISDQERNVVVDMGGSAINRGTIKIGLTEDEVEVCTRQDDRFDAVASLKSACNLAQPGFVGGGDSPLRCQP